MYETVLHVEGMSCSMCEAHINEAIRRDLPVKKVSSAHRSGQVTVIAENPLEKSALAAILNPLGYPILDFESRPYKKRRLFGKD